MVLLFFGSAVGFGWFVGLGFAFGVCDRGGTGGGVVGTGGGTAVGGSAGRLLVVDCRIGKVNPHLAFGQIAVVRCSLIGINWEQWGHVTLGM